ncbi:MAG: hypothetical protein AAF346_08360 [Pseudomonadota bacterium]
MNHAISTERLFQFVRNWIAAAPTAAPASAEPEASGPEQLWIPTLKIPRSHWLPIALRDNTELCERLQTMVEARGCTYHMDMEGTIYIYIPS